MLLFELADQRLGLVLGDVEHLAGMLLRIV
jgi:hypothetical protein